MLTRNYSKYQDTSNFDALAFELEREKVFQQTEEAEQLFSPKYEVEKDDRWCGCTYLVTANKVVIGTFYQKAKKWFANPIYFDYQPLPLSQSLEDSFRSNQLAIKYITDTYEGN